MRKTLILTIFLFILLLAVAHSEWEDRDFYNYDEAIYDTTHCIDYSYWLERTGHKFISSQNSIEVIITEEHYSIYSISGSDFGGERLELDSVSTDTVTYYRKQT